ncbi:MAG: NAD(P)/FAD-dependent oxidoreductase [Saprospiraceae bacterium]
MINLPETGQKRVVIIGAGFAGISLAQKLCKQDYQVVLIDKNNYHQFQPLFYQVAMSGLEPSSIAFPLRKIFQRQPNVFIRVTEVERADTVRKQLYTSYGVVNYDYLVIAIGADTNFYGNENIKKHAIPMKSVSEALTLRNRILEDYEHALTVPDYDERQQLMDIVIVGGGATGVEVAGALAEMKQYILPKDYHEMNYKEIDIYLIQSADQLLKGMSDNASQGAEKFLENLGVIIKKNTRVSDFDGRTVFMKDGSQIATNKMIWAAGIIGNTIEGFPEESIVWGNRFKVNRYCQVEGVEDVFAIGDIAYMEEEEFPKGHPQVAQVAMQQGKWLAKNLSKFEKEESPKQFSYKDLGSMATIGRNRAVVDLPSFKFKGFFAWLVWLFVHLFQIIGVKNKVFVFINWVWNYFTYDQSLRLIIKTKDKKSVDRQTTQENNS